MKGGTPTVAKPICGNSLKSACGTAGDVSPVASNPYDCPDCDHVMIFEFEYNKQLDTASPRCKGLFTFPHDYGDVYYRNDSHLYNAFGTPKPVCQPFDPPVDLLTAGASGYQIGDASCSEEYPGHFLNPWNSVGDGKTQPSVTPCPSTASPPTPRATCYHGANPDACPCQYDVGWCECIGEAAYYPIQPGDQPCGYTVLPSTTTTSPICTATKCLRM